MQQLTGLMGSYLSNLPTQKETKILLVASSRLYASGLQFLLDRQTDFNFRMETIEPEEVLRLADETRLEHYLQAEGYQVILLGTVQANFDLTVELSRQLSAAWNEGPVLWLDMPDDRHKILSCIRTGAKGFILESESHTDFCAALVRAMQGKAVCSDKAIAYLFERLAEPRTEPLPLPMADFAPIPFQFDLTRRELEVLESLAAGHSNREIAQLLNIELRTVKNHVHNLLGKLQVSNREEAVLMAHRYNLIPRNFIRKVG